MAQSGGSVFATLDIETSDPGGSAPETAQTVVDEHEPPSVVSGVNLERADAWARRRAADLLEER